MFPMSSRKYWSSNFETLFISSMRLWLLVLHKTKQDYLSSKSCGVPVLGVLRNTVGLHVFLSPTPPSTLQHCCPFWLARCPSVKWQHMANMSCCVSLAMSLVTFNYLRNGANHHNNVNQSATMPRYASYCATRAATNITCATTTWSRNILRIPTGM